jgi:hypothetical protein
MIREVHPNLFVGDGEAPNSDLKRLAGYTPGIYPTRCKECDQLFLGAESGTDRCLDCALIEITANWFIIHAAKEPWHRDALGYTGRGAPPSDPEYLVAKRPGELMLNLVDMPVLKEQYTNPIFEAAFEAIDENLAAGKKVLVHCNEGKSRAPTIALLWLGMQDGLQGKSFDWASGYFSELYPEYDPGAGVEAYARARWGFVEEPGDAPDAVA